MTSTEEKKQYGDDKYVRKNEDDAQATTTSPYFSSWFGGKGVWIGPRIAPVLEGIELDNSSGDETSSAILAKQIEVEAGHAIKYRTCSWQKVCVRVYQSIHHEPWLMLAALRLPPCFFPSTFVW